MILTPDSPVAVRPGETLDAAALQTFLNEAAPGFGPIRDIRQFPGGYSNLTYFLQTDRAEYVLRRPPVGAKAIRGGHDMGREFRVLSGLQSAGYAKIPAPVAFCADESVLGCPFYVMERVEGVVLRAHTAPKLGLSAETFRRLSTALIDNLAELHRLDIGQTGLIQLGKPEGFVRRQVDGWQGRYAAAQTDDVPEMDTLARYLTDHLPDEARTAAPTLIHYDYKYDNVVLNADAVNDPGRDPIRAVLDWEMCTVGDPLMDLGTVLSYWSEAGDNPFRHTLNLTWLPGNLTRREAADRYAEQAGRDISGLLYYYVFGLYKNAVITQQIYARFKKGLTADPRFGNLIDGVRAFSRAGTDALDAGRY
jgi:aminoglycoside phosphotransferase (APT) family kinase protein